MERVECVAFSPGKANSGSLYPKRGLALSLVMAAKDESGEWYYLHGEDPEGPGYE
jgi:hypothetical protein